jgi:hypothetical protein
MPVISSTSGFIHIEFVLLLFLQSHREIDLFLFQLQEFSLYNLPVDYSTSTVWYYPHNWKLNLNIDREPIVSKSHTHPLHSQTSRLLTSSLSVGGYEVLQLWQYF